MFGDAQKIVKNADQQRTQLWQGLERIKPTLEEIARCLYPVALPGLKWDVRELYKQDVEDETERLTGVPFDAFRVAYSGFYTNLTSPSRPWFTLRAPKFGRSDPSQDDFYAKELETLTKATSWLIGWCGGYRSLQTLYKHLVAFGFGCMIATPDDTRYVRTECLRVGTYALGIDRRGKVDRVVRHFAYTAEQMIEEYGAENVGRTVLEAARRGDVDTRFEVWNLIEPHRKLPGVGTPFTLSYQKFVYRSIHWCNDCKDRNCGLLAVRGYKIRPLVAPRLEFELGDIYGRGCGHNVVGRCRGLQVECESVIDIADQAAHPAMCAPASMADDGLRLDALAVNFYPDGLGPNAIYRAIQSPPTSEQTQNDMARLEAEIRKDLFNSEFETINAMQDNAAMGGQRGDHMTATEINVRVDEKMQQLSGIATTLNDELLDPFVTMMASYVKDAAANSDSSAIPPLAELSPEVVNAKVPFDIKYESAIHAAANAQPINAANLSFQYAANLAAAAQRPDILDNFDGDTIVRETHRMLGAPESFLLPTDRRDAERAARAEEIARQQQIQEQAVQAKTLKDAASAPIGPETIGGAIAGAGGFGQ